MVPEATASGDPSARFLTEIKNACERIARRVAAVAKEGSVPIVLGGDHSIALGTLGGLAATHGAGGVLWFDAHGDLNTPATSPSGNVHGMPLAAALGLADDAFGSDAWPLPAVKPEHVFLIGVRSLDDGERELVRRLGVSVYTMTDLDRRGVEPVVREVLERVADAAFVHVSLDMDVVDPDVAPGVGTPCEAASPTGKRTSPWSSSPSRASSAPWTSSRSTRSSTARTLPPSSPSSS